MGLDMLRALLARQLQSTCCVHRWRRGTQSSSTSWLLSREWLQSWCTGLSWNKRGETGGLLQGWGAWTKKNVWPDYSLPGYYHHREGRGLRMTSSGADICPVPWMWWLRAVCPSGDPTRTISIDQSKFQASPDSTVGEIDSASWWDCCKWTCPSLDSTTDTSVNQCQCCQADWSGT